MRLQYRPRLCHLRSVIGLPTSDDEQQSTLLQFVGEQTAIGVGDHSHVLATAERFSLLLEGAQRRRAARRNLDLPFPHSPPSKGTARRPIHQPQAFRSYLDVLQ